MKIKALHLKNFRNYIDETVYFKDGVNIFIGKNAQGKTNLLESIYYCCIGKSFKVIKDKDIIRRGEQQGYIELEVEKKYRDLKIEIKLSSDRKKMIQINSIPIKKIADLIGEINVVFFSPNELKLVKDSPDERRKFMDIDISQTNKRYFYQLGRYEKILANRNKLLKSYENLETIKETIDIWDRTLVQSAFKIAKERKKFIEAISPYAEKAQQYISDGNESLKLEYNCGCNVQIDDNFEKNMLKLLKRNLEKDHKFGYTTIGVHRDDINIYLNDVEVKTFGSQGQQRTVALSLKLAELENMFEITGEYPILMLDDVFSELDSNRQKRLLKFVTRTQTFITCTDEKDVNGEKYQINNGKIEKN